MEQHLGRLARGASQSLAMHQAELTGFDAVEGGPLAESWRQQSGSPAYITELKADDLRAALARAERSTMRPKRDRMVATISQLEGWGTNVDRLRIARE